MLQQQPVFSFEKKPGVPPHLHTHIHPDFPSAAHLEMRTNIIPGCPGLLTFQTQESTK